jgi:hypothetical protein
MHAAAHILQRQELQAILQRGVGQVDSRQMTRPTSTAQGQLGKGKGRLAGP